MSALGVIEEGTGFVTFPVSFKAIVFRPFKGEVVDAVVTQVNKVFSEIKNTFLLTSTRWGSWRKLAHCKCSCQNMYVFPLSSLMMLIILTVF